MHLPQWKNALSTPTIHREVGYPAMVRYGRLGNLTKWRP